MHPDQKDFNLCIVNIHNYLSKNKNSIPADKLKLYVKLLNRLKKIDLDLVSEMDWKISFEATKLFQTTELKGEILKIFKYITNIYNAS